MTSDRYDRLNRLYEQIDAPDLDVTPPDTDEIRAYLDQVKEGVHRDLLRRTFNIEDTDSE